MMHRRRSAGIQLQGRFFQSFRQCGNQIAVGPQAQVYGGRQVADAAGAIEALREELRPGDAVLVKGARVLGLETVAEALAAAVPG